ncbi:molybdenum cofactor cytidylyltransferase [Crassaminicella thermophila]|nr:molybdenum cofactor cytidylyltransferase [Crassaminicella thermophila]
MVGAVILAAGMSRRMEEGKLLLPFNGHTIIEEVIDNVKKSKVDFIEIVYGHEGEKIKRIANKKEIVSIYNPDYKKGQSTSVKLGMKNMPNRIEGVLFILGDQPFINSFVINRIIDAFYSYKASIVVPLYEGKRGNPVLFHRKWRESIYSLKGDEGARKILLQNPDKIRYVEFDDSSYNLDIDTKEDYTYALSIANKYFLDNKIRI